MTGAVRRRSTDGQGGYALIAVLVAIGVFSLVVMALLDLVLVDARTTVSAHDTASLRRAGDGALQVGIAQLKAASRARLLSSADPCAGLAVDPATEPDPLHPKREVDIEGHATTVDCTVPPDVRPTSLPSAGTGTVLTTLGGYDINVDPAGQALNGFIGLATGNYPAAGQFPGFAHAGERPVSIWGDVKVRQWTFGWTPRSQGSSVKVNGSYTQGDPTGSIYGAACGGLDTASIVLDRSFEVSASATRTCGAGRDNVAPATGPVPGAATTASPGTLTCADDSLVVLHPGVYGKAQVATLNSWFKTGLCDRSTFWFEPGDYVFDVALAATSDYALASALVFDDPTSEFVFGTPSGWVPPARATGAFPEACDRTKPGVSIVLGPTTSIQQVRGMVAMCGTRQGNVDLPMVSQQAQVTVPDVSWAGEPGTVVAAYNTVDTPQAVGATVAVPGGAPAGYPTLGKRYDGTEPTRQSSSFSCGWPTYSCGRGWRLTGLADPASPAPDRIFGAGGSAKIKILGSSVNMQLGMRDSNVGNSRFQIFVYRPGGTTQADLLCYTEQQGWLPYNVNDGPVTIDLLPICSGGIKSPKDLENATIDVSISANGSSCGFLCVNTPSVSLDYVWLETHTGTGLSPTPPPMNLNIDPNTARSFNAFGKLQVPRTQIDVKWHGVNPPAYEVPIFVGDVTAKALASSTEAGIRHIGPLASRLLIPSSRSVLLRAIIGGKVVATARVDIVDLDPTGVSLDPARQLDVKDWRYCSVPVSPTATC